MSEFSSGNVPGFQSQVDSDEAQVWWSGRAGQDLIVTKRIALDASNTDAGNTPTTTIRGGNIVALESTTGNAYLYDPDATDGRQIAVGILEKPQDMLVDGVPTERFAQMLVHGLLKEGELTGLDPRAKAQLASRFLFDRSPAAASGVLMQPRGVFRKSADYTVVAEDDGALLLATAAVNFTLPSKQNGLAFRFMQSADANLVITGSSDIVCKNSDSATTVSFATTGEKIGSHALVECVYVGTDQLKWIVSNLGGTTATVA